MHLSYVREKTGHAPAAAQQIPSEHLGDPARSRAMGLPPDLVFRTKGQLATGICDGALAGGTGSGFICRDEVYGNCTELRAFLEGRSQGYVLRVRPDFHLTLARDVKVTCAEAAVRLLAGTGWEVRSAGKGSKGNRW